MYLNFKHGKSLEALDQELCGWGWGEGQAGGHGVISPAGVEDPSLCWYMLALGVLGSSEPNLVETNNT